MGTITMQVVEGGQGTVTKTYTVADADIDRIVAAYQVAANASVNATATRNQVLAYIADNVLKAALQQAVRTNETTPPVVPAAPVMT